MPQTQCIVHTGPREGLKAWGGRIDYIANKIVKQVQPDSVSPPEQAPWSGACSRKKRSKYIGAMNREYQFVLDLTGAHSGETYGAGPTASEEDNMGSRPIQKRKFDFVMHDGGRYTAKVRHASGEGEEMNADRPSRGTEGLLDVNAMDVDGPHRGTEGLLDVNAMDVDGPYRGTEGNGGLLDVNANPNLNVNV
ncbi:hypothetical protein B0H14DRAFT_3123770, partial [Mycena olivaceomarginata]